MLLEPKIAIKRNDAVSAGSARFPHIKKNNFNPLNMNINEQNKSDNI